MPLSSFYSGMRSARNYFFGIPLNESEVARLAALAGQRHELDLLKSPLDVPLVHAGRAAAVYGRAFPRGRNAVVRVYGIRPEESGEPYTDSIEFTVRRNQLSKPNNDMFALIEFKRALRKAGYNTERIGWKEFEVGKGGCYVATVLRDMDNTPIVCYESPPGADALDVIEMAEERGFLLSTGPDKPDKVA